MMRLRKQPQKNKQWTSMDLDDNKSKKPRIGREYQANIPRLIPVSQRNNAVYLDKALLLWAPPVYLSDEELEMFLNLAREKFGYNLEQALGLLFWHRHDTKCAILDLPNFIPYPYQWTDEDILLFHQTLQFFGKDFYKIHDMLPHKPVHLLIKHYYTMKRTRHPICSIDRLARRLAQLRNSKKYEIEGPEKEPDCKKTVLKSSVGGSLNDSNSASQEQVKEVADSEEGISPVMSPKKSRGSDNAAIMTLRRGKTFPK